MEIKLLRSACCVTFLLFFCAILSACAPIPAPAPTSTATLVPSPTSTFTPSPTATITPTPTPSIPEIAAADFARYNLPTEGLQFETGADGVTRAIDPETGEVVYEDGEFDVFFVREALVEADVLMPTIYKQMTPGSKVLPGTPTNQMRGEYFVGVLRQSLINQFIELFGSDLTLDENGRRRNAVSFLLDPENNSWGAVMDVQFPDSDSVEQVLYCKRVKSLLLKKPKTALFASIFWRFQHFKKLKTYPFGV